MKTKKELDALKNEVNALNKKLAELTADELKIVVGGAEDRFIGSAPTLPAKELYDDEKNFHGCEGIEGKGQRPAKELLR